MPVDPLSSTSALIAALRAEVTRKSGRSTRGGSSSLVGSATARVNASPQRQQNPAVLRRELAEIANSIPKDDAQALDAARPRVVRAVLLWEFGSQLREYGEWQPMLDRLVQTLESDDKHRQAFARLIDELRT